MRKWWTWWSDVEIPIEAVMAEVWDKDDEELILWKGCDIAECFRDENDNRRERGDFPVALSNDVFAYIQNELDGNEIIGDEITTAIRKGIEVYMDRKDDGVI
jgi:hypothetical protein